MTDKQNQLLKKLYIALTDITAEAEQDENFNLKLAEIINKNNITNISLDDISYIISQNIENTEYYADYDEDSQSHCVFGKNNGKAYASFATKEQAENEADRMNHLE